MNAHSRYNLRSTLTYGDIYGQILIWLLVIFLSLASGLALMGASHLYAGMAVVGFIFVFSLPFILFAFTTTLLNHVSLDEVSTYDVAAHPLTFAPERDADAPPDLGNTTPWPGLVPGLI
ncbi:MULTISPECIES: hypothetical protein [Aphanothece]|uniref:hypothetical protein n=1 Tax=Aphanothece TaxID=1121 RepID=UPI003984CD9B